MFSADLVYVALHDTATDMIEFAYYSEGGERGENPSFRFGEGLTSRILQTRVPLLLNRPEAFQELGIAVVGTPAKSYLGVPIVAGTAAIGVISVQSMQQAGRFGEADSRLLSTIAANVGVAIQNARLYQETGRRASEMAALADLGTEVGGLLELDPILGRMAERAKELLQANTSAVFLREEASERLVPAVALGELAELILQDAITPGEGIIGDLAVRGAAEVVNDVAPRPPRGVDPWCRSSRRRSDSWPHPLARRPGHRDDGRVADRTHQPVHRRRPQLPHRPVAAGGDRDRERPAVRRGQGGTGGRRRGQRVQERVPRDDEPRDPNADERDHRDERSARRDRARRGAARVRLDDRAQRRGALLTIINDILDFSKIEAGRMELELAPFDLRECVEAVVDLIGPVAQRKGLELAYGIEPGPRRPRSATRAGCARSC